MRLLLAGISESPNIRIRANVESYCQCLLDPVAYNISVPCIIYNYLSTSSPV